MVQTLLCECVERDACVLRRISGCVERVAVCVVESARDVTESIHVGVHCRIRRAVNGGVTCVARGVPRVSSFGVIPRYPRRKSVVAVDRAIGTVSV